MTAPVRWLQREQLGLYTPNMQRLSSRVDLVTSFTVHCTGNETKDPLGKWVQIQQLAMAGQLPSGDRYGDHPYNGGVVNTGPHAGTVLAGRDPKWVGAHATSAHNIANRTSYGIALIGDGETLTPEGEAALMALMYVAMFGVFRRPLQFFDHRDWADDGGIATACPGDALVAFVNKMRHNKRAPFPR